MARGPHIFSSFVLKVYRLIAKKEQTGALSCIHICDGAPSIHHLLFTDDNFLFGKANVDECVVVQNVLDLYSKSLGRVKQ